MEKLNGDEKKCLSEKAKMTDSKGQKNVSTAVSILLCAQEQNPRKTGATERVVEVVCSYGQVQTMIIGTLV